MWDKRFKRPRILLDMDDTITGFMDHLCEIYNEEHDTSYTPNDIKSWDLSQYLGKESLDIFAREGFFLELKEKGNSITAINELINSKDYDVYIITACTQPFELNEKIEWLKNYIPNFNLNRIISCKDKSLINGSVLVDDNIKNLDDCSPFMTCICYDMPHNEYCTNYPRIKRLDQLKPILDEMFYSKEKEIDL